MAQPQVRFFLGANSPTGFYSLYDQLIDPATAEDIFILKGGPGCGKSSLMKKVAQSMEEHGLAAEYIQCSGDPESLDAVVFPQLKTAIVDGTAPHIVEPQFPGVVERYVNLGDCYNKAELGNMRDKIIPCMAGYKSCYGRAFRCIAAAAQIGEDMRLTAAAGSVEARLARRAKGILSREIRKSGGEPGCAVQRFLGSVTCQGIVCNFGTVDALCTRVYELCDTYGLANTLLTHLAAGAMAAGYDVIVCPCPLFPERMEHLLIPALGLAFVTGTSALPYPGHPYRRLRIDAMADPESLRHNRARLRFSRKVSAALMEEAAEALGDAKKKHDELERLYNPHVDFAQVYRMADSIAGELLARL